MKFILKKISVGVYVAFVAVALTVAAGQLYANSGQECDGPGQIGSCGTIANNDICECACEKAGLTGGFCDFNNCCTCAV